MEENKKQGMSEETKAKLVYSGEIGIIAIVFLVFGILRLTGVQGYDHTRRLIFNIITTVGAIYGIYNFISYFVSEKKRKKTALIDVITVLPISLALVVFNTYCYIYVAGLPASEVTEQMKAICSYSMGGIMTYASVTFLFQAIYHYYKPIPLLYLMLEEEKKEKEEQEAFPNASMEENKDE